MASEAWLKRHALQISAQLPENPEDALAVLRFSMEIVEGFLRPSGAPQKAQGAVLPLRAASGGLDRPSTSSRGIPRALPNQSQSVVSPGTA